MSQLINKTKHGVEYVNALTNSEIQEAERFLVILKQDMEAFEETLPKSLDKKSIDYKYKIGEFLDTELKKHNISYRERLHAFQELQHLTENDIDASADRGVHRLIFEYYYRIYNFGYEIAHSFTWGNWVDILDRSAVTKDKRFLIWLKNNEKKLTIKDRRLYYVVLTKYLKNYDTSVFEDEEVNEVYDRLCTITLCFKSLFKKYFDGDESKLTKARREHFQKYRNKFFDDVLKETKFSSKDDIPNICEKLFKQIYVDVSSKTNKVNN